MIAKNWTACPHCTQVAKQKHSDAVVIAKVAFDNRCTTQDEYRELLRTAETEPEILDTLREDWEIGIDQDGKFFVRYHCTCQQCNFEFSFRTAEQANLNAAA